MIGVEAEFGPQGLVSVIHGLAAARAFAGVVGSTSVIEQGFDWWAIGSTGDPSAEMVEAFQGVERGVLVFFEEGFLTWYAVSNGAMDVGVVDSEKALGYLTEAVSVVVSSAELAPVGSPGGLPGMAGEALVAAGWPIPASEKAAMDQLVETALRRRRLQEIPVRTVRALVRGREAALRVAEAGWFDQEHWPVTLTMLGYDWFTMTWSGWRPLGSGFVAAVSEAECAALVAWHPQGVRAVLRDGPALCDVTGNVQEQLSEWVGSTRPARMRTRKVNYSTSGRDYLVDEAAQALSTAGWPLHQGWPTSKFTDTYAHWGYKLYFGDRAYHSLLNRWFQGSQRGSDRYLLWDWENPRDPVDTGAKNARLVWQERAVEPLTREQLLRGHRAVILSDKPPRLVHWDPGRCWSTWFSSAVGPEQNLIPSTETEIGHWVVYPDVDHLTEGQRQRIEYPDGETTAGGRFRWAFTDFADLLTYLCSLSVKYGAKDVSWQLVPDHVPRGFMETNSWALSTWPIRPAPPGAESR